MEVERSTIMNFNMSKFITVPLMSLFYYDSRFHVRVDVAMTGIGTAFVNVNVKVPSAGTIPLSNDAPSSLVTVWATSEVFFQVTVLPTGIVRHSDLAW
jgi:hypothetical protein